MRKKLSDSNYSLYPSLLDSWSAYAHADISYERYFGGADDPSMTASEWEEKLRQDLINRINRVPFTSDAAMKGTQFNNAVDFFVMGMMEDGKHKMWVDETQGTVSIADKAVVYDANANPSVELQNVYTFPLDIVKEFAKRYDGALCQLFCKGTIDTDYGQVDLYGYIDYLMPFSVHDLKTTKYYGGTGTFRRHYQHLVYPLCLHQMGCDVNDFEYNILSWGNMRTYTELYEFKPERDVSRVREACEQLIRFLEANREIINDLKVFNLKEV